MGFSIYQVSEDSEGRENFSAPTLLRLSGPQGFVAAYVQSLKPGGEGDWEMSADEVLEFLHKDPKKEVILFKVATGNTTLRLYKLSKMLGRVKSERTEIMIHLRGIKPLGNYDAQAFSIDKNAHGEELFEQLGLSGSFQGGTWKLEEMENGLSAAIVQKK